MAYKSFTTDGSYAAVQADMAKQASRRKVLEALRSQALKPTKSDRMVDGRVVPIGWGEGLTKMASALLSSKSMEQQEKNEAASAIDKQDLRSQATQSVLDAYMGKDEQIGELDEELGGYAYEPKVAADPTGAILQANADPALEGSNMGATLLALNKANNKGTASQSRPIQTSKGWYQPDASSPTGWSPMVDKDGKALLPTQSDAENRGNVAKSVEQNKQNVLVQTEPVKQQKIVEAKHKGDLNNLRTKTDSSIKSLYTKQKLLDSTIDEAIDMTNWTTAGPAAILDFIPGTDMRELRTKLETIKAKVGFDELGEMRKNSPTGGALGQVSELENKLLQAVQGSIDSLNNPQELIANLQDIKSIRNELNTFMLQAYKSDYGQDFNMESLGMTPVDGNIDFNVAPEGVDPADWEYFDEQQRKDYYNGK